MIPFRFSGATYLVKRERGFRVHLLLLETCRRRTNVCKDPGRFDVLPVNNNKDIASAGITCR